MSERYIAVYSAKEKALLASLVELYKDKLESKKTDSTTNAMKNETWKIISEQYNTHDVAVRTPIQLRKCWENMKYKTRKADTEIHHSMLVTGGGPPINDNKNFIDDMVRAIVPTINYKISNSWDSTGILESEKKTLSAEPCTNTIKRKIVCQEDSDNNYKPPAKKNAIQETILIANVDVDNFNTIPTENDCTARSISKNIDHIEKADNSRNNLQKPAVKKRKIFSAIDMEKDLRIQKMEESIRQQQEIHELRVEVIQQEKLYWVKRTKLLEKSE